MNRFLLTSLVVVAPALAYRALGSRTAWVAVGVAGAACIAASAVWWLSKCHHPRPLALLPPTTDATGQRSQSRWFCGACGQTWPADFHRDHTPVPRFTGYDESKAPAAAKRADKLAQRQRELAVRRAGMSRRPPAAKPRPIRQVPETPIALHGRRRAG